VTTHLLFDFFGTLVEYSPSRTEQGYEQSWALLREAGAGLDYAGFLSLWSETAERFEAEAERTHREFSMTELVHAFLGRALPRGVDRPIEADADPLVRDFTRTYLAEWNTGVLAIDGLREMIERLTERYALAVITNTHDAGLVPDHLTRLGIRDSFGHVVTSVELGTRKPSPAIFDHTLRTLGVGPERCLYVGDSYTADYLGAGSAGIRCLLVDPRGDAPIRADDRLGSILELEKRLPDHPSR